MEKHITFNYSFKFKDTKEKGIIIFFEYIPDLNHYHFKIETKKRNNKLFQWKWIYFYLNLGSYTQNI